MEIIAEIGQNHNGDMALARDLIFAAAEAGASVAKFQLYDAKDLFPKEGNPWFDYNCKTEISREQMEELSAWSMEAGIEFMASCFDTRRINWLESVGVKRHKVASRSIQESEMIKALVATDKELLISLGMWQGDGFPKISSDNIRYLYCVSKYPTPHEDLNFSNVDFQEYAGFSDHTIGIEASMIALARGACIIEKHFTLDKTMYGPDHEGSMTPEELKKLVIFKNSLKKCL